MCDEVCEEAYRVIVWHGNISPEHRDNTTLSDGAQFRHLNDAEEYIRRVVGGGGKLMRIQAIENPTFWFESLDEYDRMGSMTADEIHAIGQRGRKHG